MTDQEQSAAEALDSLRDYFGDASSQAFDEKHDADKETLEWYHEGRRDAFEDAERVVYDIVENLGIDIEEGEVDG